MTDRTPRDRPDISTRLAGPADASAIAALHLEAFPDYFLAHLGPRFLRRYYRAFLSEPHTTVIGFVDDRPAGFVAGTTDLRRFHRDLYVKNLLVFPAIVAAKVCCDRVVRRHVLSRAHHLPLAVRALLGRSVDDPHDTQPASGPLSSLFSIAVSPSAQGSGLATAVLDRFVTTERGKGARRMVLSVFADNGRARAFYEKAGWVEAGPEGDALLYELDLTGRGGDCNQPT